MGVFPRGADNDDPGRRAVEEINRAISKLHNSKKVIYKDLHDLFVNPDGTPTKLLRGDNVHITPAGYQAWAEAIEPIVSKIVGPLPGAEPQKPSGIVSASPETIANWRKMKFGLFIHWGPVSVQGTEIGFLESVLTVITVQQNGGFPLDQDRQNCGHPRHRSFEAGKKLLVGR